MTNSIYEKAEHFVNLESKNYQLKCLKLTGKVCSIRKKHEDSDVDHELLKQPTPDYLENEILGLNQTKMLFDDSIAWGIDYCWPSVAGSELLSIRDHGHIWGQKTAKFEQTARSLSFIWEIPDFGHFQVLITSNETDEFHFEVSYPTIIAKDSFQIESLFAFHLLLNASFGDTLAFRQGNLKTFLSADFPSKSEPTAQKFFVSSHNADPISNLNPLLATFQRSQTLQSVHISSRDLTHLGIWWCNDGWGVDPHSVIGIEPTSHASDGPIVSTNLASNLTILTNQANMSKKNFILKINN